MNFKFKNNKNFSLETFMEFKKNAKKWKYGGLLIWDYFDNYNKEWFCLAAKGDEVKEIKLVRFSYGQYETLPKL